MGRYDKYEPKAGGFRAPLNADMAANEATNGIGVGLNASGRVVPGAGVTGIVGICILTKSKKAGDIVDVMTDGEIVELVGATAGTRIRCTTATGVIDFNNTITGGTHVALGYTVEATRGVIRNPAVGAVQA